MIYMYKQDFALSDPQGLMCHKTRLTNINNISGVLVCR